MPFSCHGSPKKVQQWLNLIVVTPSDIGRWVLYKVKNEKGRIKSYNDECNDDWDNYQNYTGCATLREDLEFTEELK